jgi:carboxyl-terminal processing protease
MRLVVLVSSVLVVSAVAGGLVGRTTLVSQERLPERYRAYTAAVRLIETTYVEKTPADRVVYNSIAGMLQTLDPHSAFLDPKTYAQMQERQGGRYFGLGITIQSIDGDVTATALFEGSPAYKKGVRRGDVIAKVDGDSAKGWTPDQAAKRMRGPKGTLVHLSLRRRGFDQLIELDVPRDEINIPTIPASFMIDDTTGYVRLQDFAQQTDNDLTAALATLKAAGMKRLMLDLRNNPGGPLDQAIKVSSKFLWPGQMVVYTRGRLGSNSDQDFRAADKSEYTEIPLVVLANRSSASAAEIVSGALQDHDTTFGKALVQSVYRISEGAGLALTTARYYTPSGRLIQRPWDGTFDEYLNYGLKDQSVEPGHASAQLRYTDSGRKVYGGGGVEPDHRLEGPIEGFNPSRFGRLLYARQSFSTYAQKFTAAGDTRISAASHDRKIVARDFVVDSVMVDDFRQYLEAEKYKIDAAAFAQDLVFIKSMLRYEIDLNLWTVSDARRHLIATDPQAQLALGLFPEAERLARMARAKSTPREK